MLSLAAFSFFALSGTLVANDTYTSSSNGLKKIGTVQLRNFKNRNYMHRNSTVVRWRGGG
jgi:hypothetical protein